jgi:hypothetical protein
MGENEHYNFCDCQLQGLHSRNPNHPRLDDKPLTKRELQLWKWQPDMSPITRAEIERKARECSL